jgi:hypothetical protein
MTTYFIYDGRSGYIYAKTSMIINALEIVALLKTAGYLGAYYIVHKGE